jgi:flagellar FliJ protein
MATFRFKLQPVLDLREREERERRLAVATLESRRSSLERALRDRQSEIASNKRDLRDGLSPGSGMRNAALLRQQAATTLAIEAKGRQILLQLAGVHRQLEGARSLLAEASRRRRAVEILKERRLERWLAEQKRREAAFLDDLACTRHARAGAGPTDEEARACSDDSG